MDKWGWITMLIDQEELERVTRYSRKSDIRKYLDNKGVKYWTAKNDCVFTTTEAINAALLVQKEGSIEFL